LSTKGCSLLMVSNITSKFWLIVLISQSSHILFLQSFQLPIFSSLLSINSSSFFILFTFNYLVNCKELLFTLLPELVKSVCFSLLFNLESCALRCLRRLLQLLQEFA
jgi:hypothetical protein